MAKKKWDAYRITLFSVLGLLAAVGVVALILGFVPAKSGLTTADKPSMFIVSSSRLVTEQGVRPGEYKSFTNPADKDDFNELAKQYEKLTGFKILRGVLEGVGAPRARLVESVKASEFEALARGEKEEYTIFVRYDEKQELTLKDEDGEKTEIFFDRVAIQVINETVIDKFNVIAYAYLNDDYIKDKAAPDTSKTAFASKIKMTANQVHMYLACKGLV